MARKKKLDSGRLDNFRELFYYAEYWRAKRKRAIAMLDSCIVKAVRLHKEKELIEIPNKEPIGEVQKKKISFFKRLFKWN